MIEHLKLLTKGLHSR